jgi:hypothetical protein
MRVKRKTFNALLLFIVLSIGLSDCNKSPNGPAFKNTTPKHIEQCIEPQNPYNDGGGHDAGFNWASETGGECNGNSDSFNEGCAEYYERVQIHMRQK